MYIAVMQKRTFEIFNSMHSSCWHNCTAVLGEPAMQTAFAFERTNRNYSLQHCRRISFNSYPRETYMCCLLQEVGGGKIWISYTSAWSSRCLLR